MSRFCINRSLSLKELAISYAPGIKPKSAVRRLKLWVLKNASSVCVGNAADAPANASCTPNALKGNTSSGNANDSQRREPKYINSPACPLYQKGRILYGFFQAQQRMAATNEVYLVEGYKDCLAMHAAGFTNTVAICGTSLTDDHIAALRSVVSRVFMPESISGRVVIFDVMCQSVDGTRFIVEMQNQTQDYFFDRGIYYLCRAMGSQGEKGKHWQYEIDPVYGVYFLNFKVEELVKFRTDIILADRETGAVMSNKLRQTYMYSGPQSVNNQLLSFKYSEPDIPRSSRKGSICFGYCPPERQRLSSVFHS